MARQGLRTRGGTGIWVWVLVAFGVFLVASMSNVDGPPNPAQAKESAKEVIETAQMELDVTDKVVAELKATVDKLRAETNNLSGVRDQQRAEIDQVKGALVAAQVLQTDTAARLQTELESRQASAAETEARIAQMQQQILTLTDQARKLNDEKLILEREAAQFITNQAANDERIQQLEGERNALQTRVPQLERSVVLYQEQKDNAETEVAQFRAQVRQLQNQITVLERRREEAEAQLAKNLASIGKRALSKQEPFVLGQLILRDLSDGRNEEDRGRSRLRRV